MNVSAFGLFVKAYLSNTGLGWDLAGFSRRQCGPGACFLSTGRQGVRLGEGRCRPEPTEHPENHWVDTLPSFRTDLLCCASLTTGKGLIQGPAESVPPPPKELTSTSRAAMFTRNNVQGGLFHLLRCFWYSFTDCSYEDVNAMF